MKPWVIASIVEGDGDVLALPLLLRRLMPVVVYPRPIRVPRYKVVQEDVLEHYLQIARAAILERSDRGACLVVLDAENDCPARLGPDLLRRATESIHDFRVQVVLAKWMYEAWFLAGEICTMPDDADVEEITNPKAKIHHELGQYKETADQPRLTARMNLEAAAQRSASFGKLCRALKMIGPPDGPAVP